MRSVEGFDECCKIKEKVWVESHNVSKRLKSIENANVQRIKIGSNGGFSGKIVVLFEVGSGILSDYVGQANGSFQVSSLFFFYCGCRSRVSRNWGNQIGASESYLYI